MLADMMGQAQDIAARLSDPETREAMLLSIEEIADALTQVLDIKS